MITFEIGDVIEYTTYDGSYRIVKVTNIELEGKNGKDVFDGIILETNGNRGVRQGCWGYHYQVKRVVSDYDKIPASRYNVPMGNEQPTMTELHPVEYKIPEVV